MAPFQFYSSASPTRPLPSDPSLSADISHVLEHGYVILPNQFTLTEAKEAKDEIDRLSGKDPMPGRNSFEGLNTNRIYSILNKTRVFDKFAMLPRVLELNDYFLEEGYMLTAMHTIVIRPGEKPQDLHHDDGFIPLPRPRPHLGTAIMVALDDYTALNGATRLIPRSHLWGSDRRGTQADTIPAVCPAGSVVYFVSTLWHGGGANHTPHGRYSATVQYCQPYIRPIENQILAVDPRRLDEMPSRLVDMMGYRTMRPFIGYADAMNPRRAARRMVKWLQAPLESDVPAWAHEADWGRDDEKEEGGNRESKL